MAKSKTALPKYYQISRDIISMIRSGHLKPGMKVPSENEIIRHWAGLRPATATGVPYIGEHPQIHGLFVNAGHFRNGVVMAPGSAQLLADCMLKRDSFTRFEPYAL